METLFLVLAIIVGIIVGFAATYFTLVTKLQKRLESTKSKLGRAKSASEDTETLQFQLEAQKAEVQSLQARLESISANHQTELDGLQTSSTAAIAQLTADKTSLENELQSLRESAQSLEQLPPDNSEILASYEDRLAEMEQQHQATVQSLEADYQAQITALQESLAAVPEPAQEPVAEFVPSAEEEFIAISEPEDFVPPAAEEVVSEEFAPQETEEFAGFETPAIDNEAEELGVFREEIENIVAEDFAPLEATDSPFGQAEPEEAESDLENWVDASEESPFDMVPTMEMEAEAPVLEEEIQPEIPEFTAEPPELADSAPPVEETESPFAEAPAVEEDLENWVDGPAELSLEGIPSEEPALDLTSEMSESLDLGEADLELPDFGGDETPDKTPMDLGAELPDMTEEPSGDLGEYNFETTGEDVTPEIEQTGDELLAELTGEAPTPELPMFTEESAEEPLGELELGDEMGSLETSSPGHSGNDDLDFLLELQEEETFAAPGEELLLEFNDENPIDSGFQSMEILAEESSDFPDLPEANPETYGGDPFINILDEDSNSSDNDLLALLQNDDKSDGRAGEDKEDDDLFPGLESMLGEESSNDGFDDLDALLGEDNSANSETAEVLSLDDFSFGSEDPNPK